MKVTHGECGKHWDQQGSRTGHCSGCHETFTSGTGFDRHQRIRGGQSVCLDPIEVGLEAREDKTGAKVWSLPRGDYSWGEEK